MQYRRLLGRDLPISAAVDILLPQEERQLVISTELVHFNDGGIGLRFSGDKLRSFQQLAQARQRTTAVSADAARQFVNGHRVVDQSQQIKILNACTDQLQSFLHELLQESLT